jgi:hypothetical protein
MVLQKAKIVLQRKNKEMIRLLLFIVLLNSAFSFGQNSYENEFIINYSIGHYNFGETGEYERKEIFKFKPNGKTFVLTEFQSISNQYDYNPESLKNDLKVSDTVKKFLNRKIEKTEIENLIKQLNQNENNFNTDFLKSNFSGKIDRKDILKIAKKREQKYLFEGESGKAKITGIQNFKNFEEYIQVINPETNLVIVSIDAWNFAELAFSNSIHRMDFNSILGQPISNNNSANIINLKVNLILLKILPKESLLSKKLGFENLKEGYIDWYIKNMK